MQRDTDLTFKNILGSLDLKDSDVIKYVTRAKKTGYKYIAESTVNYTWLQAGLQGK